MEDDASRFDLSVILCNSDDQRQKETCYLKLLEEHRVRGVLLTPVAGTDARIARPQRRGNPVVLVDGRSPLRVQCTGFADDVPGGDLAMSHLIEAAHQRVAYVGGPFSIRQLGLLPEMTGHRIGVPDDVTIIGYDDIEFAAAATVPLSSIRQHRRERGRRMTAQVLVSESGGDDTHQHHQVIFEPELVVRQSSQGRPRLMQQLPCPLSAAEARGVTRCASPCS